MRLLDGVHGQGADGVDAQSIERGEVIDDGSDSRRFVRGVDPGAQQRVAHGEHHRADEDADQTKRQQAAHHAGKHQQHRQVRALGHQQRAQDVVERDDDQRPKQQASSCACVALPVEPRDGGCEHKPGAELRDAQDEGHRGEQRGKRDAGNGQSDASEGRLHDCRADDAERDAADGLRGETDDAVAGFTCEVPAEAQQCPRPRARPSRT